MNFRIQILQPIELHEYLEKYRSANENEDIIDDNNYNNDFLLHFQNIFYSKHFQNILFCMFCCLAGCIYPCLVSKIKYYVLDKIKKK